MLGARQVRANSADHSCILHIVYQLGRESVTEAATNHETKRPGVRFGAGIDPVSAGRAGGIASGLSRRLRPQRELEAKIAATKNGAALAVLLRTHLERDQALEREILQRDGRVMQLMDWEEELNGKIAALRVRARELEAELRGKIEALGERETELRRQLETDDGVRTWLELVGEERATAAAIALGWGEGDDD
jgi:hypothetical protein